MTGPPPKQRDQDEDHAAHRPSSGLEIEGTTVRVLDGRTSRACTDDYNPRTIAVSVNAGVLPDGFLTVDMPADADDVTISVSGSTEPPPATPDPVSASDLSPAVTASSRSVPETRLLS